MREKARSERISDNTAGRSVAHWARFGKHSDIERTIRESQGETDGECGDAAKQPVAIAMPRRSFRTSAGQSTAGELGKLSQLVKSAVALGQADGIRRSTIEPTDELVRGDGQELTRTAEYGRDLQREQCFQLTLRPDQLARLWLREDTLRAENVFVWSATRGRWIPAMTLPEVALALTRGRIERVRMSTAVNAALRYNCVPPPRNTRATRQRQLQSQPASVMLPAARSTAAPLIASRARALLAAVEARASSAFFDFLTRSRNTLCALRARVSSSTLRARVSSSALRARVSSAVSIAHLRYELPVAVWPAAALSLLLGVGFGAGIRRLGHDEVVGVATRAIDRVVSAEAVPAVRDPVGVFGSLWAQGPRTNVVEYSVASAPITTAVSAPEVDYLYSRGTRESATTSVTSAGQGMDTTSLASPKKASGGASSRVESFRIGRTKPRADVMKRAALADFDPGLARRVIDRALHRAADECTDGEVYGDALLTFGASGAVQSVAFAAFTGDGSQLECFTSLLRRVKVSPFQGAPLVTHRRFRVAKSAAPLGYTAGR